MALYTLCIVWAVVFGPSWAEQEEKQFMCVLGHLGCQCVCKSSVVSRKTLSWTWLLGCMSWSGASGAVCESQVLENRHEVSM